MPGLHCDAFSYDDYEDLLLMKLDSMQPQLILLARPTSDFGTRLASRNITRSLTETKARGRERSDLRSSLCRLASMPQDIRALGDHNHHNSATTTMTP